VSGQTVTERGRRKAYRPLLEAERRSAFAAGLAAYDRGDFFLAHELLEPAWMGSPDATERALHSGLIKLAAAGVHARRGNPAGVAKNLSGARERLAAALGDGTGPDAPQVPEAATLDVAGLIGAIDLRLAAEAARPTVADPPPIPRRVG
jgi:hypothetical protein